MKVLGESAATLVDLVRERAERTPDRALYTFVRDGGEAVMTFGELSRRARAVAVGLAAEAKPGDRVLLLHEPGLDFITSFFGCLFAGVTVVASHPPRTPEETRRLAAIVESARPSACLADASPSEAFGAFEGAIRLARPAPVESADAWRDPGLSATALAMLQFTSGSTRAPRGVCLSHANLLANLETIGRGFGSTEASVGAIWLPPYHDMGLIGGILHPLYAGFPVFLMPPATAFRHPKKWLELVSSKRATISGGPNFAYAACTQRLDEEERRSLDLSSWAVAFNGAEPIRAETLDAFANAFAVSGFRREALYPCYGLAEATLMVTGGAPGSGHRAATIDGRPLVASGQPMPGQTVLVVDPETRMPVPPGQAGEIWIAGANVAAGYWEDEAATEETFRARTASGEGPFLRSGDLGFLDGEDLFVTGRSKEIVIQRGRKHHAHDLEAAARSADARFENALAAVFPVEIDGEERVVVAVASTRVSDDEGARLSAAVRDRVFRDEGVVPSAVLLVPAVAIPRTTSGKIRRLECARRYLTGELRVFFERKVTIADLLESDWSVAVGAAGSAAQSLEALRILARVEEKFGVRLPLGDFLADPTLGSLASRVEHALDRVRVEPLPKCEQVAAPLSFAQERLWVIDTLDPGNPAYNVPVAFRIRGPLDRGALQSALDDLVRRHSSLRTVFRQEGGELAQRIEASVPSGIRWVDLGGTSDGTLALNDALREEARSRFTLARAPLFRVTVFVLAEGDVVLSFVAHHIVCDGWSLRILGDEIAALYAARLVDAGPRAPGYPPPAVDYVDFAAWQRTLAGGSAAAKGLAFWRHELAGVPTALELPRDRARPPMFSFRGSRTSLAIDPVRRTRVHALAAAEKVTPFVVFFAAFQVWVRRVSGQTDFVVGTPAAGRSRRDLEDVVGFFVNLLPIRAELAEMPTFRGFLARTAARVEGAITHQDVPFERLVQELTSTRDISMTPLVQAVFAYQVASSKTPRMPSLELSPVAIDAGTAIFDLVFSVIDAEGELDGYIEYNADVFDAVTIEGWRESYLRLLDELVAEPTRTVDRAPFLAPGEHGLVVDRWNDTLESLGDDVGIHELFFRRAEESPMAIALDDGSERVTYATLAERARSVEHRVRAAGVNRGDRVAVLLERSADVVPILLGILSAGATYVPLDPRDPPARTAQILDSLPTVAVVTRAGTASERLGDRPNAPFPSWASVEPLVVVSLAPSLPSAASDPRGTPDDFAYVIFTSGSTGKPKGVAVRHRPAVNVLRWINRAFEVGPGDVLLFVTSLCFDLSVYDIFGVLAAGATIRVTTPAETRDPSWVAGVLTREPITIWDSAPASLQQVLPFLPLASAMKTPGKLRRVMLSGDWIPLAMPTRVKQSFPECQVTSLGGATEATIWSNWFPVTSIDRDWVSIPYGKPIANARYYVLDENLAPCPIGVPGDLFIGGAVLAEGYATDLAQTAERFVPDPHATVPGARMYTTGDRARWKRDGNLEFLGRRDHQVKIRGYRVELGEIASVLGGHPAVADCVVLAHGARAEERRLVAYVVHRTPVSSEEMKAWARARLADFMVPSAFVAIDRIPSTPNGKLDTKALVPPSAEVQTSRVLPRSPVERTMARLWADALGVEPGIHDNFFDLGGNSLLLSRVYAGLCDAKLEGLSMVLLFEHPTIASLASRLKDGAPSAAVDTTDRAAKQLAARKKVVRR